MSVVVQVGGWVLRLDSGIATVSELRVPTKDEEGAEEWFEIPTASSLDESQSPPFDCAGHAIFIYHDYSVYAKFADARDRQRAEEISGTRRLTEMEVRKLNTELAYPYLDWTTSPVVNSDKEVGYFGLGDAVSWLMGKLGFTDCGECQARRTWLNRIPLWVRRRQTPDLGKVPDDSPAT
jgi:hypothetical protein